jgi:hypothetical protein
MSLINVNNKTSERFKFCVNLGVLVCFFTTKKQEVEYLKALPLHLDSPQLWIWAALRTNTHRMPGLHPHLLTVNKGGSQHMTSG